MIAQCDTAPSHRREQTMDVLRRLRSQNVEESLLRQFDASNLLHPFLTFLLIFEVFELALIMSCGQIESDLASRYIKRSPHAPPYKPAVTSARKADKVSRATIRRPTAAWMGTSKSCRGITLSEVRVRRQSSARGEYEVLRTQFLHPCPADFLLGRAMDDQCQSIDRLVVQEEDHLRESLSFILRRRGIRY